MSNEEVAIRLTDIYCSRFTGMIRTDMIADIYKTILRNLNKE